MFCDAWRIKTFNELKTRQALKVVGELGDVGVAVLGITGGEPLIRKDLEEIADCAKAQRDYSRTEHKRHSSDAEKGKVHFARV